MWKLTVFLHLMQMQTKVPLNSGLLWVEMMRNSWGVPESHGKRRARLNRSWTHVAERTPEARCDISIPEIIRMERLTG